MKNFVSLQTNMEKKMDTIGAPFDRLYIDADLLAQEAAQYGYAVGVVAEGEPHDYSARIFKHI